VHIFSSYGKFSIFKLHEVVMIAGGETITVPSENNTAKTSKLYIF
jgi:hypothetical protein